MTLADFLLARIDEDRAQAVLRETHDSGCDTAPQQHGCLDPCDCGMPERMLADCEAKRGVVEIHRESRFTDVTMGIADEAVCMVCHHVLDPGDNWDGGSLPMVQEPFPCRTLRAVALPYAGHPEFREEWKL